MQKLSVSGDKLPSRVNITQAAKMLGLTKQALGEMLRHHPDEAPMRGEDGLFDFGELKTFHEGRGKVRTPQALKVRVLEEELRLKKVKADEAEDRVITKDLAFDMFCEGDRIMQSVLKETLDDLCQDESKKAKHFAKIQARFKTWRDFLSYLAGSSKLS